MICPSPRLFPSMLLLCTLPSAGLAQTSPTGLLCSDLSPTPPLDVHKVKNKVIYDEVVAEIFPGALFPMTYAEDHEVTPSGLYYDDRGRVMSARAVIAILQNHHASQDAIAAWRGDTEAQSQARMEATFGVAGAVAGDPVRGAANTSSALEDLSRLEGGPEAAFAEAVCAFNSAQAARRARERAPR